MFKWFKKKIAPQPDEFARGIAEIQLALLLKIKKSKPDLQGKELYIRVLSFRPTYGTERATRLVEETEQELNRDSFDNVLRRRLNKEEGQLKLRFRDVVCALVEHEYFKFSDGTSKLLTSESGLTLAIMRKIVENIISDDL